MKKKKQESKAIKSESLDVTVNRVRRIHADVKGGALCSNCGNTRIVLCKLANSYVD
jgi:UDP-N-acetylglucosamine pyrophosphorylase